MHQMIDPIELYNALYHLGLKPNEAMNLSKEEEKRLMDIYEEVVLDYFRTLFPNPTKQNFIRKRRDKHGRMLVDILCRSCGKEITVNNRRMVFCPSPAPCKNNFHEDKRSLFELLDTHSLDLANRIKKPSTLETLEVFKNYLKSGYSNK